MGINPVLIRQFRERDLDEYDWIKEATHKELNYEISLLDPQPEFHQQLYLHQKACFLIGITNPKFCFFLDMGTGKTALTLSLLNYHMKCGLVKKTLVLVPNQVAIESWDEQCAIFAPNLVHVPLFGSSEQRLRLLQQDADIYTINYAGLYHLCCQRVKGKSGKGRLVIDDAMTKAFRKYFDAIVLDESHLAKNHTSLTYRVLNQIVPSCKVRYALTGTPFGRNPEDFWAQFRLVDGGDTLGKTLGLFREAYFTKKKSRFGGGFDYKLSKRREKEFQRALKHRSIWYDEKECQDLPKLVQITKKIAMPEVYRSYYKSIKEQVIELQGDKKRLKGAFMKMRQVSSGFLAINDEASGDKIKVDFGHNPRLEMLLQLVEDMPSTSKMVVFHEFIYSGDLIQKELRKLKIKTARLGTGAKDPMKEYKTFKTDPKCRIFVVNNHAGSMALNLQNANYVVYYESPVSPIDRRQSQKRCHRGGQTKKVFMYDIVMKGSVDERVQAFLKEGRDLFSALMDPGSDIEKLLGPKK